jgi:hypothetical protein
MCVTGPHGAQGLESQAWAEEFAQGPGAGWANEFSQTQVEAARSLGKAGTSAEALEQTKALRDTLASSQDPKLRNSKFLQFVSKMSRGEIILEDNQVTVSGPEGDVVENCSTLAPCPAQRVAEDWFALFGISSPTAESDDVMGPAILMKAWLDAPQGIRPLAMLTAGVVTDSSN